MAKSNYGTTPPVNEKFHRKHLGAGSLCSTPCHAPILELWELFLKMIPRFDGKNAYWWLINVEQYFDGRGIPEEEKLSWAWLAMEGREEIKWWYRWKSSKQNATWWDFVKALFKKFQPEFDPDIRVQEEGSESWEQENRGKNEALKFKNQVGREEAIHKEVEQRNVLRKGTRSKSRKKSTKMVNCRPRWILCKTFKQKLEAGLGEAFKGSWQQKGLRGFSFDPGGTWLSEVTSYSP
ncbi:hypothetical protein SESBI_29489 [Sesbania bispinosa]|nr:hypothetical protein SESBI_29489 [Sesbania bispinosa]